MYLCSGQILVTSVNFELVIDALHIYCSNLKLQRFINCKKCNFILCLKFDTLMSSEDYLSYKTKRLGNLLELAVQYNGKGEMYS